MSKRPVNICSGQFGDIPFDQLCAKMHELGYDGFEVATQAHVDVYKIVSDEAYRENFKATLAKYDMQIGALSAHLAGQCVGDNWDPRLDNFAPNAISGQPEKIREWAIDFMKNVPTTWDDVKFIDGYPGKYCIMARRTGDRWYVVGINAQESSVKLKLSLPMFAAGSQLKVYSDTPSLEGSLKSVTLSKKQQIQISIPCNGGLVITE